MRNIIQIQDDSELMKRYRLLCAEYLIRDAPRQWQYNNKKCSDHN